MAELHLGRNISRMHEMSLGEWDEIVTTLPALGTRLISRAAGWDLLLDKWLSVDALTRVGRK